MIYLLFFVFCLLSAQDVWSTFCLLRDIPGACEANPVAAYILEAHGWWGMIALKVASVVSVGLCCLIMPKRVAGFFLLGACLMIGFVVYHNWTLYYACAN